MNNSEKDLPRTPDEVQQFMEDLEFGEPPTPEQEAELLASLPPPGSEVMVVHSLRLSLDLLEQVKAEASARGVQPSTLMREWISLGLTAAAHDRNISLADALRALANVRSAGDNAA